MEKLLFLEAIMWLSLAKLGLIFLPFRKILPLLQQKTSREVGITKLDSIKVALSRASVATPWRSTCLTRSIAARWMLKQRKIPSRMAIGMGHDSKGKILMHAYIAVRNVDIVSRIDDFKELFLIE